MKKIVLALGLMSLAALVNAANPLKMAPLGKPLMTKRSNLKAIVRGLTEQKNGTLFSKYPMCV